MSNIYNLSDNRWSAVGTTYNALLMNLTNGSGGSAVGAAASRPLSFKNNGTTIFEFDLTGNLIATPNQNSSNFSTFGIPVSQVDSGEKMQISGANNQNVYMTINDAGTNKAIFGNLQATGVIVGAFSNTPFGIVVNGTTQRLGISTAGAIKFNNYGAGAITADASGNLTSVSDENMKFIEGDFKFGLKELLNLNPIEYKWRKESGMETEGTYAGFSAQNVRDNIPLATGEYEGKLTLQDRALLAVVVNSIKELNSKVEAR